MTTEGKWLNRRVSVVEAAVVPPVSAPPIQALYQVPVHGNSECSVSDADATMNATSRRHGDAMQSGRRKTHAHDSQTGRWGRPPALGPEMALPESRCQVACRARSDSQVGAKVSMDSVKRLDTKSSASLVLWPWDLFFEKKGGSDMVWMFFSQMLTVLGSVLVDGAPLTGILNRTLSRRSGPCRPPLTLRLPSIRRAGLELLCAASPFRTVVLGPSIVPPGSVAASPTPPDASLAIGLGLANPPFRPGRIAHDFCSPDRRSGGACMGDRGGVRLDGS